MKIISTNTRFFIMDGPFFPEFPGPFAPIISPPGWAIRKKWLHLPRKTCNIYI